MALQNIVWLASYPKSGNTWTRAFLANYLLNTPEPLPINQINRVGLGDAIPKLYHMVAGGPYDTTDNQKTVSLRAKVLRGIVGNGADLNFVKTHNIKGDAFGSVLIPSEYTRSAVYIVRNPLDVAVSYSRHYRNDIDETIMGFANRDHVTMPGSESVMQFLGNWSEHVVSWANSVDFPVHVMRYEDMLATPEQTFGALLEALSIPMDEERLSRAIRHASFDELSKQEAKSGFIERSENSEKFFHTGTAAQWKSAMTPEQAEKLRKAHRAVMIRFGYL